MVSIHRVTGLAMGGIRTGKDVVPRPFSGNVFFEVSKSNTMGEDDLNDRLEEG